ncbi:FecR family protein [Pedobacter sp.]|uniref:FecR family protein n=1 Tax=Pedobacter sp. TaxID=1411316 RepID=UPI003D7FB3F6
MTRLSKAELNQLADKYLRGTITPVEKEIFDQWYNTDDKEPLKWAGHDAAESALEARMLKIIQHRNRQPHRSLKLKWLIPAAAAAILIVSGILFFHNSNIEHSKYLQAAQQIKPGKNSATLTLADGSKINLEAVANGQLIQQAGFKIIKTADGQLIYEAENNGKSETKEALTYNTIEVPKGGKWEVRLPDHSLVFLNASSKLTYPTKFEATERKVQVEGEAYFEIRADKNKPFRVLSKGQMVQVFGTHFNVMAYPGEHSMKTTLLEGSVQVTTAGQSMMLVPGQQAQVKNDQLTLNKKVDLEEVIAWKNGYFKFNDNLESIMDKVARWYNIEVRYDIQPDPQLRFSGKISRSRDLSGILEMLSYNGDVHFKIEGRRVTVIK